MGALILDIAVGIGAALLGWIMIESILSRILPRLERVLPSDVVGPGGWLADTTGHSGIFDLPMRRKGG